MFHGIISMVLNESLHDINPSSDSCLLSVLALSYSRGLDEERLMVISSPYGFGGAA